MTVNIEETSKGNENNVKEPKLTLLNMRWCYDGGGMACGPVEGNTLVELMVRDENGRLFFILESRMSEFEKILVSEYAMFDIAKHVSSFYTDFDYEWEKIMKNAFEEYDYEIREIPEEEMKESKFYKAFKLARYAMSDAYGVDDPVEEEANDFVSEYLDENILEMDIPEVIDEDYEDEDEDYDDDEYDET
jgi:hypothetical protein